MVQKKNIKDEIGFDEKASKSHQLAFVSHEFRLMAAVGRLSQAWAIHVHPTSRDQFIRSFRWP